MMPSEQSTNRDGFTLLEMLVGLILLSLIATIMVGAFQQVRPLKQIEDKHQGNIVADILADVIAADVGGALELASAHAERQGPLDGEARRIEFAAIVKTGFRLEGLRNVKYALEPDPAGILHLKRSTSLRVANSKDKVSEDDDLFSGISDLSFSYLKLEDTGSAHWQEAWINESKLPRAIRVDLVVKIGNRQGRASRIAYFGPPPAEESQPVEDNTAAVKNPE